MADNPVTEVAPVDSRGRSVIQSYGQGRFRLSGTRFAGSVLVLVDAVIPWPAGDRGDVSIGSLSAAVEAEPPVEILLLGAGTSMRPLAPDLRAALKEHGIVGDAMDTGAACRTFNVLAGENRPVAAALIASD